MTPAELAAKFEDVMDRLGGAAADAAMKVYKAWQSGLIDTAAFTRLLADLLANANVRARAVGDVFATVAVNQVSNRKVVPLGPIVTDDSDRLGKAANTIAEALDTDADVPMQLDRIARNEPVEAAQQQVVVSYDRYGVNGYRRHTEADPCELCVWLVKAHLDPEGIGYIYPARKPMYRHTGCRCTPVPAVRKTKGKAA